MVPVETFEESSRHLVKFVSLYFGKHNTRVVSVTHETDGLSRFLGFAKSVCLCVCLSDCTILQSHQRKSILEQSTKAQRGSELYLNIFCFTSALDGGG